MPFTIAVTCTCISNHAFYRTYYKHNRNRYFDMSFNTAYLFRRQSAVLNLINLSTHIIFMTYLHVCTVYLMHNYTITMQTIQYVDNLPKRGMDCTPGKYLKRKVAVIIYPLMHPLILRHCVDVEDGGTRASSTGARLCGSVLEGFRVSLYLPCLGQHPLCRHCSKIDLLWVLHYRYACKC